MIGPILGGTPFLRYPPGAVSIVFDGNSLGYGSESSNSGTKSPSAQMAPLAPLNGNASVVNIAVPSRTISDLRARGTQYADGNYIRGKKNILFFWEGTNSVCLSNMTGAAAGAEAALYCSERLAAHPDWMIILLTTIPRFDVLGSRNATDANAELLAYDAYLKNNYKAMGAKAVVDVRAGGIFKYTGPSMDPGMRPYMAENIHCNDAGYALVAQYCADGLKKLRVR